jgi:hypothetical protein
MKKEKWIFPITTIITIVITLLIFFAVQQKPTGKSVNTNQVEIKQVPLSSEEAQKVANTILSSEFIKDVPEKNPVALVFFKFENGERVWQSGFLIGNNKLLTEGTPSVTLTLNSKYISELNGNNICDIIKEANKNGDLGFESSYGTASLLLKYAGMLKHRACFGF